MLRYLRHVFRYNYLFPTFNVEEKAALHKTIFQDASLTKGYILMCVLSAGIATIGLLQSSVAVVIGAMLVSPLMGPIAGIGFALAELDGKRIRESALVLGAGVLVGVAMGAILTIISPIKSATPEIIARTQPNLLDLAVAMFSGFAGAYATIQQKGATAIGVAIATALMPPLATVGYAIGIFNIHFFLGASLLFLTNLAAISFSFAITAFISGATDQFNFQNIKPKYIISSILVVFIILGIPLGLTLNQIKNESRAQSIMRGVITETFNVPSTNIAQMDVKWPLGKDLDINAIVITPQFHSNMDETLHKLLKERLGDDGDIHVQQIVASDTSAQTQAMIDAAIEKNIPKSDTAPLEDIRRDISSPIQSLWVNRAERIVNVSLAQQFGWTIADYRNLESDISKKYDNWTVNLILTDLNKMNIRFDADALNADDVADATWLIERLGLTHIRICNQSRNESEVTMTNRLIDDLKEKAQIDLLNPEQCAGAGFGTAAHSANKTAHLMILLSRPPRAADAVTDPTPKD